MRDRSVFACGGVSSVSGGIPPLCQGHHQQVHAIALHISLIPGFGRGRCGGRDDVPKMSVYEDQAKLAKFDAASKIKLIKEVRPASPGAPC